MESSQNANDFVHLKIAKTLLIALYILFSQKEKKIQKLKTFIMEICKSTNNCTNSILQSFDEKLLINYYHYHNIIFMHNKTLFFFIHFYISKVFIVFTSFHNEYIYNILL